MANKSKLDAAELAVIKHNFLKLVLVDGWSPMYAMGLCGIKEGTFRKHFRHDLAVQRVILENKIRKQRLKRNP